MAPHAIRLEADPATDTRRNEAAGTSAREIPVDVPVHPHETATETEPPSWRNDLSGTVQGSVAQAQRIYAGVHVQAARPTSLPPPAQLPPSQANFTARTQELAILDEHVIAQDPGQVALPAITGVGGVGGVGKTALALHWLHQVSGQYPGRSAVCRPIYWHQVLDAFGQLGVPEAEAVRVHLDACHWRATAASHDLRGRSLSVRPATGCQSVWSWM